MEKLCDVCGAELSIGVVAVPMVPIAGYGRQCLNANAHPWWVMVGNTACCAKNARDWRNADWQQLVDDTMKHLGKTEAEFCGEVQEAIDDLARA